MCIRDRYLCGRWSFLDFELIVGPGVLCPRADTEVVAETAAQTLSLIHISCEVTADNIKQGDDIEILNPEWHIATLGEGAKPVSYTHLRKGAIL